MPAASFIALLNATWYGSPLNSGYGRAGDLYALANVWPNATSYAAWFLQSESAWALVGLLAFLAVKRRHFDSRPIALAALMIATTLGCYLAYSRFDAWWYLRFLLPAAGAAATVIAIGMVVIARAVPAPWGRLAAAAVFCMLVRATWSFASGTGVFGPLRDAERHYVDAGVFVARNLPANAVVFTKQHSGSARFYGGRMTLRYDQLDKDWAPRAAAVVEHAGMHPYMLIDDWEIADVRSRFGFPEHAPLPWPVVARTREAGGVTVLDLTSGAAPARLALESGSAVHRCSGPALSLKAR
jgi:hypothetical protein